MIRKTPKKYTDMRVWFDLDMHAAEQYTVDNPDSFAVHLHTIVMNPNAPTCFKAAINRGEFIAHVFSKDTEVLEQLARQHGIRVIYIDREGMEGQHIDMCGRPLRNLLTELGCSEVIDVQRTRQSIKPRRKK